MASSRKYVSTKKRINFFPKGVKNLPDSAGVYIMKSKQGNVFYVGKALSLHKRVGSYFSNRSHLRTDKLIEKVEDIDYIECDTQEQALILEAALIKELKPKYNIALRDSKTYPYIEITNEEFARVFISRPKVKSRNILFGPYPRIKTLKSALEMLRKIFPYRSCKTMPKTACLFFDLKLCPAPCEGRIFFSEYKVNIESICKVLKGERRKLARGLRAKMKRLGLKKDFESAAKARDKLRALENLYKGKPREHQIMSLKRILNLSTMPLVIEAIDVSSLGLYDSVGSVVVFRDGVPDKSSYRRFLIKEVKAKDDYAKIAEVIRRRYVRLIKEKKKIPDLIIVDGGLGHVTRSAKELRLLDLSVKIIGIAKRNEEVWFPGVVSSKRNRKNPLCISKDNPCLHLIQRIRDEAHRFAHSYQLVRRRKRILK